MDELGHLSNGDLQRVGNEVKFLKLFLNFSYLKKVSESRLNNYSVDAFVSIILSNESVAVQ